MRIKGASIRPALVSLQRACVPCLRELAGEGIRLPRCQAFGIIVVHEALQQTEPTSFIALVSGRPKAILVGGYAQLRPSVRNISLAINFGLSRFEVLYMRKREAPGNAVLQLEYYKCF